MLYIVATPIGNLQDISSRALETLKTVDFIICEDTRITSHLLARYEIQKPLVSYFQHSRLQKIEEIISRLADGQNAALVTDAGTPSISDPGGVLVNEVIKRLSDKVKIIPIPGPCAAIAALSISGFPADKFLFLGFPPHKKGRQKFFQRVFEADETVVFYESCHRIIKSLTQLRDLLLTYNCQIPTQLVVARELTKMFESVYRGTIEKVFEKVSHDPIKGEYVVIFSK